MTANSPSVFGHESDISHWEAFVGECGTIPLEGQDQLRQLLQSGVQGGLRDRIIRLLNPREGNVVKLSDEDYNQGRYDVPRKDNYARPFGAWERNAVFDAARGYYAIRVIRPLKRRTEKE